MIGQMIPLREPDLAALDDGFAHLRQKETLLRLVELVYQPWRLPLDMIIRENLKKTWKKCTFLLGVVKYYGFPDPGKAERQHITR